MKLMLVELSASVEVIYENVLNFLLLGVLAVLVSGDLILLLLEIISRLIFSEIIVPFFIHEFISLHDGKVSEFLSCLKINYL